jgi:hypothetical protein
MGKVIMGYRNFGVWTNFVKRVSLKKNFFFYSNQVLNQGHDKRQALEVFFLKIVSIMASYGLTLNRLRFSRRTRNFWEI